MYREEPKTSSIDLEFDQIVTDTRPRINTRSRSKTSYPATSSPSISPQNSNSFPPKSHIRNSEGFKNFHSSQPFPMKPCLSIPPRLTRAGTSNPSKPHLLASRPPRWSEEEVSNDTVELLSSFLFSQKQLTPFVLNFPG